MSIGSNIFYPVLVVVAAISMVASSGLAPSLSTAMGKNDAALEMWQKAIEIDPDFLSKHNSTPLYEGLKALGLIE